MVVEPSERSVDMKKEFGVMVLNSIANVFLSVLKIVVGFLFNSQLLLADGIHSASDLLTDIFSIIGLKLAEKPEDEAHPFGHGKLEYAAAITVSMIIFFVTYNLILEVMSEWNVVSTEVEWLVMIVAAITFVVKYLLSNYVLKKGRELHSLTLENSGVESKTDAYSTVVVMIGLVITAAGLSYDIPVLVYGEKIATVFVIGMLLKAAGTIYFNAIVGIAGTYADKEIVERYSLILKEMDEDVVVESLLVFKEGISYAVALTLAFDRHMDAEAIHKTFKAVRHSLAKKGEVNKVSIDIVVV